MAIRVAFAYLTGVEVFHGSERDMNRKQKGNCYKFGYTQWWYVSSHLRSRMTEVELMAVFGRYQSRNMKFDHINNMLRNAMAKMDQRKHKFQFQMIQCLSEILNRWIDNVKLPGVQNTSCLELVKNICMKQLEDFAQNNDEVFNTDLANQIIDTYVDGGNGANLKAFDFVNELNVDGNFSKQESTQKWVSFLADIRDKIKQQTDPTYGSKKELHYIWRFGRILFGCQATLSSTLQLERTFSLLMLNLEKRRFNLGERQHSSEARIMIFIKNAAKTKEVLDGRIFDNENNKRLKEAYKNLIPWYYCTKENEETDDESLLDDSVENETSDEESQSHNWPSQSDSGRKTTSKSQPDGGRRVDSESQPDGGRRVDSDRRSTSKSQSGTGQKTSSDVELVYSSEQDKSFAIPKDGSIDIYDNSNDIIPTGNGHNFDTITDLVRYPF